MKNSFKTFCYGVLGFFVLCGVIGVIVDDDNSSGSKDKSEPQQVEQKQETETNNFDDLKKSAYNTGYDHGFTYGDSFTGDYVKDAKDSGKTYYELEFGGAPKTDEERKQYNIYIESFVKGFLDGHKAGSN